MKRLTYNNLIKAMKYLKQVKHYDDVNLCEKLARNAFDLVERNNNQATVEHFLSMVLTKEEYETQCNA